MAKLQPLAKRRSNVIGRLQGTGRGYDLMLNGHLDTFAVSNVDERKYTFARPRSVYTDGSQEPRPPKAIDEEWLFGHEIANMKGAFAAYLAAVDALIRSGIPLKGAMLITGVAGTDPTFSWTHGDKAATDDDLAIGTRYMLSHGVTADMCVLGEPTNLELVPAHTGRLRLKLMVSEEGQLAAAKKMSKVVTAFERWIPDYQSEYGFKTVTPYISMHGPQCHEDMFAGDCNLYLEIRVLPTQKPLNIVDEVRTITNRLHVDDPALDIVLEPLLVEPGSELDSSALVVQALRKAHQTVTQSPPKTSYVGWGADAPRLNQAGIPTVIYGPGTMPSRKGYPGAAESGREHDYLNIEELETAARVYAAMAEDVCTRARSR
jgi:acetylornithine deacetylase/succinyl-diaminopimelate desuccinylase-like protein